MSLGLGLGLSFERSAAAASLLSETTDWQTRVIANGGTVSAGTLSAVDTFIGTLKGAGLWTKLLRLNLFAGDQLAAALVPLVVGAGNSVDTNVNFVSGDYSQAMGLSGDGSTKYLNTGLALNSATGGLSAYVRATMAAQAGYLMGVSANAGADLYRMGKGAAGTFDMFWGQSFAATKSETSIGGFYHGIRRGGSDMKWYRAGAQEAASVAACTPAGLPTPALFIFARNNGSGVAGVFLESGLKVAGYAVDDGTMSVAQETTWNSAWQALQASLGRSV